MDIYTIYDFCCEPAYLNRTKTLSLGESGLDRLYLRGSQSLCQSLSNHARSDHRITTLQVRRCVNYTSRSPWMTSLWTRNSFALHPSHRPTLTSLGYCRPPSLRSFDYQSDFGIHFDHGIEELAWGVGTGTKRRVLALRRRLIGGGTDNKE